MQTGLPNSNVLCSDGDGLIFKPSVQDEDVDVLAYLTHHPVESSNVLWDNVKLDITRQTDLSTPDFELIISLLGLGTSGDEALIGEKIITTCPTTELSETVTFDLLKSSCQPAFSKSSDTAPAGKIRLNLPMRWKNFEAASLTRQWLSGWAKRKVQPITGASSNISSAFTGPITIPYVTGMNADFSDVRFVDSDGQTLLGYWRYSYTASSTATFYVKIPLLTALLKKNIYMYYGNSSAVYTGSPFDVLLFYDDFEDGKYTGRSSPYRNWTLVNGTATLNSSSPISGTYSLQHTGTGTDDYLTGLTIPVASTSYIVTGKVKLITQGVGTYTPYNVFWYLRYVDSNNFIRVDQHWNGSNRIIKLNKHAGGVETVLASYTWSAFKWPVNEIHSFTVKDTGTHCTFIIDSTTMIDVDYSSGIARGTMGLGACRDTSMMFDNIQISPFISPTIGTLGNEESTITIQPDTPDPEQTYIDFTTPADWSNDSYSYLTTRKIGNYDQSTRIIPISNLNVLNLGYDAVSKYYALRTKIEANCNSDYNFGVTKETFAYLY